ncbi:blasticidin-S deaminase-like [Paramacrobiotus metropolitanus]|uniref:blasticidin-S deaminase-like n=1 Tax=Paramacrobiotus metropolitanus TaxID=2943436 RepID=UPI0024464E5B|nr:blasticidin-S deaminase-like [Paramacrobiotus metropolitanus]
MIGGITPLTVTPADEELAQASIDIIEILFKPNFHAVGAALRTKSGKLYTAVHLEAGIGRIAVCAEAIVLGKAISEGETEFDAIVAALHQDDGKVNVCSPCGMCRELLTDYQKDIDVILLENGKLLKCKMMDLLPLKYSGVGT